MADQKPPEQRWCRQEACEIQRCLARKNYQEDQCQHKIEAWEKCAEEARQREQGEDEEQEKDELQHNGKPQTTS